jgi:hypothetical protein
MTLSRRERVALIALALALGLISALLERSIAAPATETVSVAPAAAWDAVPIAHETPTPAPPVVSRSRGRTPLDALRDAFSWLRTAPASPSPTGQGDGDVPGSEVVPAITASVAALASHAHAPAGDRPAVPVPVATPTPYAATALFSASMVQTMTPAPGASPTP